MSQDPRWATPDRIAQCLWEDRKLRPWPPKFAARPLLARYDAKPVPKRPEPEEAK